MSDTRSGRATDRVVGAAADENDEEVASWAELADDVAGHVDDFLTALDAVASGGAGAQAVALLLLEVSQVHFVGAQLGAAVDVIPRDNTEPAIAEDPDLDAMRQGLAEQLHAVDDYVEVFDPYGDGAPVGYRLSDDLADIAEDLVHGMRHYRAGRSDEALWWWQFSYLSHWGNHSGAALRALQAVVAHARLDTTPEPHPDEADESSSA
jgi:hypothetical protein